MAHPSPDPRDRPAGRPQSRRPSTASSTATPGSVPAPSPRSHQAIADLDRQRDPGADRRRTFLVDLVMRRPRALLVGRPRSARVGAADPAARRDPRRASTCARTAAPRTIVADARRVVARRGSHGVLLKAPDHPAVVAAVDELVDARHPGRHPRDRRPAAVGRLAYVGIDNRAAGATAAYLLTQWSTDRRRGAGDPEQRAFRGEEEREIGFRAAMREARRPTPSRDRGRRPTALDATMLERRSTAALDADPGDRRGLLDRWGQPGDRRRLRHARAEPCPSSWRTTSMPTTLGSCCGRQVSAVLHHDLRPTCVAPAGW